MMHPPLVRLGYPPQDSRASFAVLLDRGGWIIGKWHSTYRDTFVDGEFGVPWDRRTHHFSRIRCWMPQDGS